MSIIDHADVCESLPAKDRRP